MAHLEYIPSKPINTASKLSYQCQSCRIKTAKVRLVNDYDAKMELYCLKCGEKALAEFSKYQNKRS
jgi:predicted SprT family Zn-dependent metalloprotease